MKTKLWALALFCFALATAAVFFFRQIGSTRVSVPPRISIPRLLDHDTRAETLRDFLLRSDRRGMGKIFAREGLEEFKTHQIAVHPFPLNAKPVGYIVSVGKWDLLTAKSELLDDPFRAGRLYTGRERTLFEDPSKDLGCAIVVRVNGTWDESLVDASITAAMSNALIADFDADGNCDSAEESRVDGNFAGHDCEMDALVVSGLGGIGGPSLHVEWNLRRRGGIPTEWMGWWFEDADGDGVFDLNIGSQREGKAVAVVTFHWNKAAATWSIVEHRPNAACRARMRLEGEWSVDFEKALMNGTFPPLSEPLPEPLSIAEKPPAGKYSSPWKLRSLVGLSHAALLDEMQKRRDLRDVTREEAVAERNLPPLWTTPPRELAAALIRAHRDVSARNADWIGFDSSDGETPPEQGMVTFSDGPSGCFAPGGAYVTDVYCEGERSFIARNSSLYDWANTPVPARKSEYEFRAVPLSAAQARQILQTAWWLSRARVSPGSGGSGSGLGGSTSDGWATVRIQSHGAKREWTGIRVERWGQPLLGGIHSAPNSSGIVVNVASWMFEEWMPDVFGDAWKPQPLGRIGKVLEDFLAGRASYEAVNVAVGAAGETGDRESTPFLEKVLASLPKPTASETRRKEIAVEMQKWRAEYGNEWTAPHAVFRRERARKRESSDDLLPGIPPLSGNADSTPGVIPELPELPGIPGIPGIPDASSAPAPVSPSRGERWSSVSEQELWLFGPVDALDDEGTKIMLAQSESERSLATLRDQATAAIRNIGSWNDVDGLQKHAREDLVALRRLCEIAPTRALDVIRGMLPSVELYEQHDMNEAIFELQFSGRSAALESDIDELDAELIQSVPPYRRMAEKRVRLLVPPKEPMRYPWPALDQKLIALLKTGNATGESCLALARRAPDGAWDALATDTTSELTPLAIMAYKNPVGYREKLRAGLSSRIEMADSFTDSPVFAAWLADVRELAPALERIATSSAADAEEHWIPARRHQARWILSLWTEPDAATRAKLLLAFAMGDAFDAFDAVELPEAEEQLKSQFFDAWEKADALGREDVRAFVEWCGKSGRVPPAKQAFAVSVLHGISH
jgi:hypothetical protein